MNRQDRRADSLTSYTFLSVAGIPEISNETLRIDERTIKGGAGLVMGEGIAVAAGCAVAMILKSMWVLPY